MLYFLDPSSAPSTKLRLNDAVVVSEKLPASILFILASKPSTRLLVIASSSSEKSLIVTSFAVRHRS